MVAVFVLMLFNPYQQILFTKIKELDTSDVQFKRSKIYSCFMNGMVTAIPEALIACISYIPSGRWLPSNDSFKYAI